MVIAVRTSDLTYCALFLQFSSLCSLYSNTNVTELFRPSSETNSDISRKERETLEEQGRDGAEVPNGLF